MNRSLLPLVVLGVLLAANSVAYGQSTRVVSFRENANKTGAVDGALVAPPLRERWSIDEPVRHSPYYRPSYPVIADGLVFVTYATSDPPEAWALSAYSAATGELVWGPIRHETQAAAGYIAYDRGVVITLDFSGNMDGVDGATGRSLWSIHLGSEYYVVCAPTVYAGVVYAVGSYEIWAVDTRTGNILWHSPFGGTSTSPVVTEDAVYVTYTASLTYRLRRSDGQVVWRSEFDGSGGGGQVPVLYRDRVYTRGFTRFDPCYTLDAATGARQATNPGGNDPAFSDGRGFFVSNGMLEATDVKSETVLWTFDGGGSEISTSAHVIDGYVYVGSSSGDLWALDPKTGAVVWSTNLGAAILGHPACCDGTFTDLAAWGGLLLVTTTERVVALESVSAEASYDLLVADDHGALELELNSTTGAYRLTECGGSTVVTGVGSVTRPNSCTTKLVAKSDAATVTATLKMCKRRAKAVVHLAGRTVKITDKNLDDDVRGCS